MRNLSKVAVRRLMRSLGYEIRKVQEADSDQPVPLPLIDLLDLVFREYMRSKPNPFFVQIGAHDGASADPLKRLVDTHGLRGILVEPQPLAFAKLRQNYSDQPQLIFENGLVGAEDGEATLYTVKPGLELPFWLEQSASLNRSVVSNALRVFREIEGVTNIPEDYESLIEAVSLPALTWSSLLSKHAVQAVDLLVIDAMGFDFEIIKTLPLGAGEGVAPHIIHFEHAVLSEQDRRACLQHLASHGYSLAKVAVDTIAYRGGANTRTWPMSHW